MSDYYQAIGEIVMRDLCKDPSALRFRDAKQRESVLHALAEDWFKHTFRASYSHMSGIYIYPHYEHDHSYRIDKESAGTWTLHIGGIRHTYHKQYAGLSTRALMRKIKNDANPRLGTFRYFQRQMNLRGRA